LDAVGARQVETAAVRVTLVDGTFVGVVALAAARAKTDPHNALIGLGAHVAIVAWSVVERMEAFAQHRVTRVIGAQVIIVTIGLAAPLAVAIHADVHRCAIVEIVAGRGVGNVVATIDRIAEIIGTNVAVTAIHRRAGNARTQMAVVPDGARIVVITGQLVQGVDAFLVGPQALRCADVVVIALFRAVGDTDALETEPALTGQFVVRAEATIFSMTTVIGARITVVAVQRRSAGAFSLEALVTHGAHIAVVARLQIVLGHTAQQRIARIVSAGIAVTA